MSNAFTANLLRRSARAYASAVVEYMHAAQPRQMARALPASFAHPTEDTEVRLLHLAEAVAFDRPELLQRALAWYKVAFHHRAVDPGYLTNNLDAIAAVLQRELPTASMAHVLRHLEVARGGLQTAPVELPTVLSMSAPHGKLAAQFLLAALEGRGDDAVRMVRDEVAAGMDVPTLHDQVLTPVLREIGRMWLMAEVPIADEHYGSSLVDRVLWSVQDSLPPVAADAPLVLTLGVGGNTHDLGLRMVAQRLVLAGLRVHNLGADMPTNDLQWALQERPVELVAISAAMILHLSTLASAVVDARRFAHSQRSSKPVPILVGGEIFAHVPGLAAAVGADAGAGDAVQAVAAARALLA